MMDLMLEMVGVSSMAVLIGMVGKAGDMDGKGGKAGATGTFAVGSSDLGTSGVASLTLLPFLHGRGVFC